MQHSYYPYQKRDCNLIINKMPVWFEEKEFSGDKNEGTLILHTQNEYDEVWGSIAKMDITWEKIDRTQFLYSKAVQESIDVYNAIKVVVTDKENAWLRSHEYTIWYGNRNKMVRKRYYSLNIIHGVFYCDMTERLFNMNTEIIKDNYEGFKPYILESYNSILCHE